MIARALSVDDHEVLCQVLSGKGAGWERARCVRDSSVVVFRFPSFRAIEIKIDLFCFWLYLQGAAFFAVGGGGPLAHAVNIKVVYFRRVLR